MKPVPPEEQGCRRPWGRWEILLEEAGYKVKRITVRPGKRLSYQKHRRRQESWTVVQGSGLVTLEGKDLRLGCGESVRIPLGAAHRVRCAGRSELVFIEVQTGSYLGEDDIIRLQDDFGRATGKTEQGDQRSCSRPARRPRK